MARLDEPAERRQHDIAELRAPGKQSRWGCRICGDRAFERTRLEKSTCAGYRSEWTWLDKSHEIHVAGFVVFCMECGHYGEFRRGLLRRPCPGHATAEGERRRRRVQRGLHPKHNLYVGPLVKLAR